MFDLGDTLFANTFKAQFEALRMAAAENGFQFVWENTPTYNPEEHIQSWFTVRIWLFLTIFPLDTDVWRC